jgi:hypothetical protein
VAGKSFCHSDVHLVGIIFLHPFDQELVGGTDWICFVLLLESVHLYCVAAISKMSAENRLRV